FALADGEADAVDGSYVADRRPEQPTMNREILPEVVNLQQAGLAGFAQADRQVGGDDRRAGAVARGVRGGVEVGAVRVIHTAGTGRDGSGSASSTPAPPGHSGQA